MARTKNRDAGTTAVADKVPPGTETSESPAAPPTYDDIARRAYELYQQRGGTGGQDWDDWLRAEAELREGPGRRDDEV
jgi:hypothetical protein